MGTLHLLESSPETFEWMIHTYIKVIKYDKIDQKLLGRVTELLLFLL